MQAIVNGFGNARYDPFQPSEYCDDIVQASAVHHQCLMNTEQVKGATQEHGFLNPRNFEVSWG